MRERDEFEHFVVLELEELYPHIQDASAVVYCGLKGLYIHTSSQARSEEVAHSLILVSADPPPARLAHARADFKQAGQG